MKNDLLSSLRLLIAENGKDALDNISLTGKFIYTNTSTEYMPECEVLMICLILEYHKWLNDTGEPDRFSVKRNIVEHLTVNEGLNVDICNRTLDILEAVLFEIDMSAEEVLSEFDRNQKQSIPVEEELDRTFLEGQQHTAWISDLQKIKVENDKNFISFAPDMEHLIMEKDQLNIENAKLKKQLKITKNRLITAIILGVIGLVISIGVGIYEYNKTTNDNTRLVFNYNLLKSDYDNLFKSSYESDYESLSTNYDSLKSDYNKLSTDYNSHKYDYERLSVNYNSLKNDYNRISAEYERSKAFWTLRVTSIKVGNWGNNRWLVQPGERLYARDIRYLMPVITYNSLVNEQVVFYVKIINSKGIIDRNESISPAGYSYSTAGSVSSGNNRSFDLTGWGNADRSSYTPGEYTVEVWNESMCLRSEKVRLY